MTTCDRCGNRIRGARSYCLKCDQSIDNGPICHFLKLCRDRGMTERQVSQTLRRVLERASGIKPQNQYSKKKGT